MTTVYLMWILYWNITRLRGPVMKIWCVQIKFLQRIVTGLYLGLYKGRTYHFLGRDRGGIVGPPYWQIKRINPFFILNPFPYHEIMKIQIPPSSQILNCTHNITPGLKRKRTKKKQPGPSALVDRGWSALCIEFLSVFSNSCSLWVWSTALWIMSGAARLWYSAVDNLLKQKQIGKK